MNSPPANGILTVSPSFGVALTDTFLLKTSLWTDDVADYPLRYIFSYYAFTTDSLYSLKSIDNVPYVSTLLGQGLQNNGYAVYCVATAVDLYDAQATAKATVVVSAISASTTLTQSTSTALAYALANQDPAKITQLINAAASSANFVNCGVPTDCASINRQVCSTTARTCGVCLPGYIGLPGHSNVACQLPVNFVSSASVAKS
eukprot:gene12524-15945_t